MTELLPARPVPEPSSPAAAGEGRGNPVRLVLLASLLVLAGVRGGWSLLAMIGALVVMIFLHELGHFLTAKWAGMKVTEFFIGFGPKIWSFRRGETEYGLKVIPAGAYVKIVGMHNLDEFPEADADRTYMSKPFWRRLSVAVAGSTMHFLLAAVCFVATFAFVGLPGGAWPTTQAELDRLDDTAPWAVRVVSDGSGAERAGIRPGDEVVSIDGEPIDGFAEFRGYVSERPGQEVEVVVRRDGTEQDIDVSIGRREGPNGEPEGFFGVGAELLDRTVGFGAAIGDTGAAFAGSIRQTLTGLAHILSPSGLADLGRAAFTAEGDATVDGDGGGGSGSSDDGGGETQAAGIVRISSIGAGLLGDGEFGYFLAVFATINIFIGVFNLVPLLPLDGGHVAIACYEKVRSMLQGGRPYHVDVVKLLPVTYAAVMVLAFLGVSTLVLDTRSLVGG
jgi:membrane-associated protease RseP (regulator of RpoE activity)